MNLYIFNKVS